MIADASPDAETRISRRGTALFIVLFWITQFSLLTIMRRVNLPEGDDPSYLLPRACVAMVGILLSFGIVAAFDRFRGSPIRIRLGLAVALALAGCVLHAAANFGIFGLFMPEDNWREATFTSYAMSVLQWFWSYLALSGLLLALSYSLESAERERRMADLRRVADAAQLRALRYQLNPHFMFNTLNSIAALIGQRAAGPAELMVENLADFLRASLSLDPHEDIPLAREIELQSLYLAIEAVRFSDRFDTRIEVSDAAARALVPSLVLQPLIENVIRHAVAPSTAPVTLAISATVDNRRLIVCVRNSTGDGAGDGGPGTGVGLANVAARLAARFGEAGTFTAAAEPDGGFAVRFSIPYMAAA